MTTNPLERSLPESGRRMLINKLPEARGRKYFFFMVENSEQIR